jgi:hypothetical protein
MSAGSISGIEGLDVLWGFVLMAECPGFCLPFSRPKPKLEDIRTLGDLWYACLNQNESFVTCALRLKMGLEQWLGLMPVYFLRPSGEKWRKRTRCLAPNQVIRQTIEKNQELRRRFGVKESGIPEGRYF